MPLYLVERYIPDLTVRKLGAATDRVRETASRLSDDGVDVQYLFSTVIPSDESVLCVFRGPDRKAIERINEVAEFPFARITEAFLLGARGQNSWARREES
jgi:hypothetical protein